MLTFLISYSFISMVTESREEISHFLSGCRCLLLLLLLLSIETHFLSHSFSPFAISPALSREDAEPCVRKARCGSCSRRYLVKDGALTAWEAIA